MEELGIDALITAPQKGQYHSSHTHFIRQPLLTSLHATHNNTLSQKGLYHLTDNHDHKLHYHYQLTWFTNNSINHESPPPYSLLAH